MTDTPPNGLPPDVVDAIRSVLRAGGVPEHRIEWMARSCPSLERAILFYPPKVLA